MRTVPKEKLVEEILDREGLPSLSPLTVQLIQLAADEDSSADDLAGVIEKDPALTTRLLKLLGSAFFARQRRVGSIAQGIVLLGFRKVRIMALTLSLKETFPLGTKGNMDYDLFWKTSLYRALIAQDLARSYGQPDTTPEEMFIAGLILEIGALMVNEACSQEVQGSFPKVDLPLEDLISWEETHLGFNHREVSALVLEKWQFPPALIESQRYFGTESLAPDKPLVGKIAELARRGTESMLGQTDHLYRFYQLTEEILGLQGDTVNTILSSAFDQVEALADQLRISVDTQADMIEVMEKANRSLVRISSMMENSFQGFIDQGQDSCSQDREDRDKDVLQNTLDAVAHEIRNPLTAIGAFATKLASEGNQEDRGREYARVIAAESARLEKVLKEMKDYSRPFEPAFSHEDLIKIMNNALENIKEALRKKGVEVFREYPEEELKVRVDSRAMEWVFQELLNTGVNIIDRSRGRLTISLTPEPRQGRVTVEIANNARTMPDHVYEALVNANPSAKTFEGGLRLPMVGKIVDAHGGSIRVRRYEEEGNTITVSLPRV